MNLLLVLVAVLVALLLVAAGHRLGVASLKPVVEHQERMIRILDEQLDEMEEQGRESDRVATALVQLESAQKSNTAVLESLDGTVGKLVHLSHSRSAIASETMGATEPGWSVRKDGLPSSIGAQEAEPV